MEGLIPLVYKNIKKSRTRRHYQYLSSAADFYMNDDHHEIQQMVMPPPPSSRRHHHHDGFIINGAVAAGAAELGKGDHDDYRRSNSIHVDYLGRRPLSQGKLVRFRSHNYRLFSCVSGGGGGGVG